jgi:hypothetical protein
VPGVRLLLPRRDDLDPVELPPPQLIALLFFGSAVGLLLLRGG